MKLSLTEKGCALGGTGWGQADSETPESRCHAGSRCSRESLGPEREMLKWSVCGYQLKL